MHNKTTPNHLKELQNSRKSKIIGARQLHNDRAIQKLQENEREMFRTSNTNKNPQSISNPRTPKHNVLEITQRQEDKEKKKKNLLQSCDWSRFDR
jgi:hypothetical protein